MKKLITIVLAISISLLFITCSKKPSTDTLLKIEDKYYSLQDFFNKVNKESFTKSSDSKKRKIIKNFVKKDIYTKEAKKTIKDHPSIEMQVFNKKVKYLVNPYVQKKIMDSIVTKEKLKKVYKEQNISKPFSKINLDGNSRILRRLRGQIMSKNRKKSRSIYNDMVKSVKENVNLEINDDLLKEISNKYTDYANVSDKADFENFLDEVEISGTIMSTNNKEYDLNWLNNKIKYDPSFKPRFVKNKKMLKGHLNNYIITKSFLEKAEKSDDLNKNQNIQKKLSKAKLQAKLKTFFNENISNSVNVKPDEIKSYYNKNKQKYNVPTKAEVREIYTKDKNLLDSLRQEILKSGNFEKFADKYTERKNQEKKPGYLGYISNNYGSLGAIAINSKENTVVDTLIKNDKGYSLIKVYDKKESHPKPLDKVKNDISSTLRSKKINQKRKELFDRMKRKYNVKIYWDTVNLGKRG